MLDRTIAPPFNRNTEFELIKPEKLTLGNGAEAYFIAGGGQQVIKVELLFKAGRWYESTWGAAYFTGNLLSKGTKQKSSFQIAQIFDLYGAHLEVSAGLDVVSVSLYSLTKHLEPTLRLLVELLTDSIFPEKELDQTKSIYLQNLKVNNEKTSFQASKLIRKNLFGENHPYGKELDDKDVTLITTETLKTYFEQYFKDLFLIVSGKVDNASKKLITELFGQLPTKKSSAANHVATDNKPARQIVDKDGSVQSTIRIGKRFINRSHPDYYDVLLLNHIFGGYFGSRLMKNIREEKGLSYGIYSSIHTLNNDSYLVIGSDVNKENLELTFDEIRKEMVELRTNKIDTDELETARNHFIGSLQSEITTPFAHADKLKNIILFNLPADYYQKLIKRLDTLSAVDLLNTANKYFNEDSFHEVAVG